jgi:hypothetical protein
MRNVIILAGGASVAEYNLRGLENHGRLIAVNDSALYTKCDVCFTMDRLWLEGRQKLLKTLNPPEVWYRKGTPKNFKPPVFWHSYEHVDGMTDMTDESGRLHGSNSGTCALNYVYQRTLSRDRIFLLGFDMQRGPNDEKHWYPDYPWSLEPNVGTKPGTYGDWVKQFDSIHRQFYELNAEVFNVNHRSLIKAFTILSFARFQEMTLS